MEWINSKDRIPESNEAVLVYLSAPVLGVYAVNSWCVGTDQDDKWFKRRFTHWMPLPEPPKS